MILTYKQRFNKRYGFPKDKSHSLEEIAKLTGYTLKSLKTVFQKGDSYEKDKSHLKKKI